MQRYTLIITEKPDAAQRIATALDVQENPKRRTENGVPYYVAQRETQIVIVPALGHLYTVAAEKAGRNHYPVFTFKWTPKYLAEKNTKHTRTWLEAISKLARDADEFIDACDYDIEGSLIGYTILKYACENKEQTAKRMKYSTLTKEELENAYSNALPHLDFQLIEAGRARHEVDWLYGINLTRALTITVKNWSGQYATLSTGRVQGPTLKFLVAREKTIRSFVPTPYWQIKAQIQIDEQIFEAEYEKEMIEIKKEADDILNACKEKEGQVEKIDVKQFQQFPPFPFDLGNLQREAFNLFNYTPRQTANIAQHLYLDALISYPRTSSQKLPPIINYEIILKKLNRNPQYEQLTAELLARPQLKPNEGKKEDPAHPAIYPTGNQPEKAIGIHERKILDLIIRRFMAVFAEPAIRQSIKANININKHHFCLKGRQTLQQGWIRYYAPYERSTEIILPPIKEGQVVTVKKIIIEDKFTKPPPRYNAGSILRKMEQQEIGTKATRADIIQTLYDRKYVCEERINITDLGFEILKVLEEYCPTVISIKLTRELEERMNNIQMNNEKRETVLIDAVKILKPVLERLKENEKATGEQLSNALRKSKIEERTIGACPVCHNGKLFVIYSRKTGKRFAGCTNYFKGTCKASYPLPQKGTIKPLGKSCHGCGWPTIHVKTKGRRPWTLCLNPACPLKKK
jgi:DNA topoisomerase I